MRSEDSDNPIYRIGQCVRYVGSFIDSEFKKKYVERHNLTPADKYLIIDHGCFYPPGMQYKILPINSYLVVNEDEIDPENGIIR